LPIPETLLTFARGLRRSQTDAEKLLWFLLRDRRLLDCKFRRQYPFKGYILDFYCCEKKLAIELDGGGHNDDKQQSYDKERTQVLVTAGITVLRFWNHDVLQATESVLQRIYHQLTIGMKGE
jgi:type I restriction enzyme M protein